MGNFLAKSIPSKYRNLRIEYVVIALLLVIPDAVAQFTLSGEVRPRSEYRHGFSTLATEDQPTAFFTEQRTRLNLNYANDKYKFRLILQDVRTWGSQPQLTNNDGGLTTIHEGWVQLFLNDRWSTKLGRQEIAYDDHRIFGDVNWAQQARSHDALLIKYMNESFKFDVGLAYNQDGPQLNTSFYSVPRSYKTFQYIWAHKDFENFGISALLLNNGRQGGDPSDFETFFTQTAGTRLTYKSGGLSTDAAIYHQFGEEPDDVSVNALLYSLNVNYALNKKHSVGFGYEFISGNDQTNANAENNAFNPFYGTNHKFNGLMDYFYVGNHINNIGLRDLSFNYKAQLMPKWTSKLAAHFFSSDGDILDPDSPASGALDRNFGIEIDWVSTVKVNKEVTLNFGYSQMFASETLEVVKGGDKSQTNNWAWAMISIKPTFFTIKNNE